MAATAALAWGTVAVPSALASSPPTPRAEIQHLLRRFAFSATPQQVTQVQRQGKEAWLAEQLSPGTIDDHVAEAIIEPIPPKLTKNGYVDYDVYERRLVQRSLLSQKQLLEKMELHWMDHFSVSLNKVGDPAVMDHYVETIRKYALGNFTALAAAVGKEPAMMYWLDNDGNTGPKPNENFGREMMQLFVLGDTKLNDDGSQILGKDGLPINSYTQNDVREVSRAVTGYYVKFDYDSLVPASRFATEFDTGRHIQGLRTIMGRSVRVPDDLSAIDAVVASVASQQSSAPFLVKELLQRFVTEKPSPTYVADIVAVWRQYAAASDQLAQVMKAIALHPEFDKAYHAMPKQPIETEIEMARELPLVVRAKDTSHPAQDMVYWESQLDQEPYYPPSVFSFYRPGNLISIYNTHTQLAHADNVAYFVEVERDWGGSNIFIDMPRLRTLIGSTNGNVITDYLIDALVDTTDIPTRSRIASYLGDAPDDNQIRGAIWLLADLPIYAVN